MDQPFRVMDAPDLTREIGVCGGKLFLAFAVERLDRAEADAELTRLPLPTTTSMVLSAGGMGVRVTLGVRLPFVTE